MPRGCCRCVHGGRLGRSTEWTCRLTEAIDESPPDDSSISDPEASRGHSESAFSGGLDDSGAAVETAVFRWYVRAPPIHTAAAHVHHSCSMLCKTALHQPFRRSLAAFTWVCRWRRANNVLHSLMTGANSLIERIENAIMHGPRAHGCWGVDSSHVVVLWQNERERISTVPAHGLTYSVGYCIDCILVARVSIASC